MTARADLFASRWRKRPVVIEAMEYPGMREHRDAMRVLAWLDANGVKHRHEAGLVIQTLEGEMLADPGDWIIKGVAGEFYPCKPGIFVQTYEPACDGTVTCPEERHIHGCYADMGDCDRPEEHRA